MRLEVLSEPAYSHASHAFRANLLSTYTKLELTLTGITLTGIGMHRDAFNAKLVSTYITLGVGRKLVVLLPPTPEGNG